MRVSESMRVSEYASEYASESMRVSEYASE